MQLGGQIAGRKGARGRECGRNCDLYVGKRMLEVQSAGFLVHVALIAAHPACTFDPPQAPFAIVHPETPLPPPSLTIAALFQN